MPPINDRSSFDLSRFIEAFTVASLATRCQASFIPLAWTGFVTLPCREREVSAPQELSGRCDCGPPRGHRRGAKRAVRLG